MPARKRRPDKYGIPKTHSLKNTTVSDQENVLAQKFIIWEAKAPYKDHYVGWPDMDVAERMEKRGLLRSSDLATGCFYLTDLFRRQFRLPDLSPRC